MSSSSSSSDLRNRIIFTIAILAVYRFGRFVPLPGIDPEQLKVLKGDKCLYIDVYLKEVLILFIKKI